MKYLLHGKSDGSGGNFILLIIRLTIGGLMLTHGWSKMLKLFEGGDVAFADPLGISPFASLLLAVIAEVLFSIFLILGLLTRLSALGLAFTMFIAAFIQHGGDPLGKKELALIYLLIYTTLLVKGSGKFSLDYLLSKK